jgi:hypothetical protein
VEADESGKLMVFMSKVRLYFLKLYASPTAQSLILIFCFFAAARFDVFRVGKKKSCSVAKFVDLDFVGHTKRLKFHFSRTDIENDIWVEAESDNIAPWDIHTNNTLSRQRKKVSKDEVRSNKSIIKTGVIQ